MKNYWIVLLICCPLVLMGQERQVLTLQESIRIAQEHSPEAQAARQIK